MLVLIQLGIVASVSVRGPTWQHPSLNQTGPSLARVHDGSKTKAQPLFTPNDYLGGIDSGENGFRWDHTPAQLEKLTD